MAVKAISISNMLKKKHSTFTFRLPWSLAFTENPSDSGIWLIWGKQKNGKTSFALMLAKFLATLCKILYISAEEGTDKEFVDACRRSGISENDKNLQFLEYTPLAEVREILKRRNSPHAVVFDNLTVYRDDFKQNAIQNLKNEFPDKLFIFLSHEDRNEPSPSVARNAIKLAKVIIHIKGLKALVSGRGEVGGVYNIDEQKAKLYWGENNDGYDEQD